MMSSSFREKIEMKQQEQPLVYVNELEESNDHIYTKCLGLPSQLNEKKLSKPKKHILLAVGASLVILVLTIAVLLAPLYFKMYSTEPSEGTDPSVTSLCLAGYCSQNPLSSCIAVPIGSLSGNYWVRSSSGKPVQVFCDTSDPCDISSGSWMRVAKLDMSDGKSQCPRALCKYVYLKRFCYLCKTEPSCSSEIYSTKNVPYSRVCGRAVAYQIGTPNAFYVSNTTRSIDEIYVDGVSLTHGRPRSHIWTFAADHTENALFVDGCHCNNYNRQSIDPPSFVGTNYFCDTADPRGSSYNVIFTGDPLWDGLGCGPNNHCCLFNNPPWFYTNLSSVTSDDIEMRICRGGARSDEDIALEIVEIYVQ